MKEVIMKLLDSYRKQREQLLPNLYVVDGAVQACEQLLKRLEEKVNEEANKK
mgnify:CR=1 FL=1